jgi:2',3'-cyclic-nucleotide 2'-phosphodiesterase (5'-nucleotidase family)
MRSSSPVGVTLLTRLALVAGLTSPVACGGASGASTSDAGADPSSPETGAPDASTPSDASTAAETSSPPPGRTTIRLIHFNDLHAHLVTHTTLAATPDGTFPAAPTVAMRGGIARLATKIKALRSEVPAGASVLMNIGDTYHGGVEALYTQGEAIAKPVNALGIDVGVPGNWDYAYGPDVTRLRYLGTAMIGMQQCIQEGVSQSSGTGGVGGHKGSADGGVLPTLTQPNFPNLAANVTFLASSTTTDGQAFLPGTLIKEVAGVKVGFIGLSSDIVPRMHPMLACGLSFLGMASTGGTSPVYSIDPKWTSEYQHLVDTDAQTLRNQGAQVVVVMSELGIQKNNYLANVIAPGMVDVVFSAHTHETVYSPLTSKSGALVVEAGDDTYVGHMDIELDQGKVVGRAWKLEPVTESTPEDPAMASLVAAARAPFLVADPNLSIPGNTGAQYTLTQPITTVLGKTSYPLTRKNALDSSFNEFFTAALANKAGTALGMAPGFRYDSPNATASSLIEGSVTADGRITIEDAFRFFPVVYGMGTASVTGAALQTVMEDALDDVFTTDMTHQNGGWVEGFAGLTVGVNLAASKGMRVQSMSLATGLAMDPNATYTIAGCRRPFDATGVLCSHGGFTNVQDFLKPDNTPWTDVEIFMDAVMHSPTLAPKRAFTDASGTQVWPQTAYVQPLNGATGH